MNFVIPHDNNSELLIYLWKITDLPYISQSDLLYRISFDLFLLSPDEAKSFINRCIKMKLLIRDVDHNLKLSNTLKKKLLDWQNKRKHEILEKIYLNKKISKLGNQIDTGEVTSFNVLIKAFLDKGTLNRAASLSNNAFDLIEFNPSKGIIKANVVGSKEESYFIELDIDKKILKHNCHDFETRRAENKKFCKHIVKLFLLLKEKDPNSIEDFLKNISNYIDEWEFII